MDSDAFLRQIGAIALLSAQDEVDLARRMRAGAVAARELTDEVVARQRCVHLQELVDSGDAAREQMVQANLRLVVSVARRYRRSGVPMLDLVQEGTVGLIQAVDRFDPDRGCRFSTYAMWWIRQAINRGLADAARQVRLPRSVQQQLSTCHARRQELMARLGREPSKQELAAACGLSVAETVALLQADPQPLSLDVTNAEDNDVADRHGVDPVEEAARRMGVERLQWAMQRLDPLELEVLSRRYGFNGPPQGCTAVAEALDLSRDRVRSIEARALRSLGSAPGMAELMDAPPRVRPGAAAPS
jgi:RNA polymerase sigma factor (sigma-70 family)